MNKLNLTFAAVCLLVSQVNAQGIIAPPQAPESPLVELKSVAAVNTKTYVKVSNDSKEVMQDQGDEPKRAKTFTKSFTLDNSDKVSLSNQYGSITIKTWDKKEIKADITMEAFSNNDKEAQRLIDDVNIDATKNGDLVTIKTNLSRTNERFGKSVNNGKVTFHREVKVNFTIYMPSTNALTTSMQYGNVTIGDFSAPTSLKVQYGNLVAGKLTSANNYINVQYGKCTVEEVNKAIVKCQYGGGLNIGTAGTVDLNVQYASATLGTIKGNAVVNIQYGGGLTIGSVDNIELDAQYANVKINTVNGNANIKQQYNSITINSTGKLNINTEYTNITVGTLRGDGNFKTEYNKLTIGEVTAACKNLTVRSEYTGITLGFSSGYNAAMDVQTSYAGFKYGSNVTAKRVRDDDEDYSSDKNYLGKIGNGGTATVKVKADYGSVTFK